MILIGELYCYCVVADCNMMAFLIWKFDMYECLVCAKLEKKVK